jgi:hypothetical protein
METTGAPFRTALQVDPRMLAISFGYWLVFLLSLEPGNIERSLAAGDDLSWRVEAMRIAAASVLGSLATPILLAMARGLPLSGRRWRRNALLQGSGVIGLAIVLIAASCVLAKAFLPGETRPLGLALEQELPANGPLVAFCLAGFVALAHAIRFLGPTRVEPAPANAHAARFEIRAQGRVTWIDAAEVDWIEAQGNYVALHVGGRAHLLRESLASLEAKLHPTAFVRVHRRTIVARSRIASLRPLGAGDAEIVLKDGARLRLSRTYRQRFAGG